MFTTIYLFINVFIFVVHLYDLYIPFGRNYLYCRLLNYVYGYYLSGYHYYWRARGIDAGMNLGHGTDTRTKEFCREIGEVNNHISYALNQ